MKIKALWLSVLLIVSLLLTWCKWKDVEETDIISYVSEYKQTDAYPHISNTTNDLYFKDIPDDFSWGITSITNDNFNDVFYFSWALPIVYNDKLHWLAFWLTENAQYSYPSIHYQIEWEIGMINIKFLWDWEYKEGRENNINIVIIPNNESNTLDLYDSFYHNRYMWKNNKYTFYFIAPLLDYKIVFPWIEKEINLASTIDQLFIGFNIYDI